MSQCQVSGLLSLDEALEKLLEKPVAITDTLSIPLHKAAGYILSEHITSPLNYLLSIILPWMVTVYVIRI